MNILTLVGKLTRPLIHFKLNFSYESWDNVFINEDVDIIFNNFLNTYLRIFNTRFPTEKSHIKHNNKPWLTTGIKISCNKKRELYLLSKHSNHPKLCKDYKLYCKILSQVITAAKEAYYNKYVGRPESKDTKAIKFKKNIY
jgi:hypothetical protein